MRLRSLLATALVAAAMAASPPAHANVGSACGGWRLSPTGGHQNACYVRDANYTVAGRGRAYYTGSARLDQLSISVTLQTSADGVSWSNVTSRTCGFTDVARDLPGQQCLTSGRYVVAGMLYRARTFLVLFESSGAVRTTTPSYSPITT